MWKIVLIVVVFIGCSHVQNNTNADAEFNVFLDAAFDEMAEKSPEFLTALGIKKHYGRLDNRTEAFAVEKWEWSKHKYTQLLQFDRNGLSEQGKISFDLFKKNLQDNIDDHKWRHYNYPVNQMYGIHSNLPAFMMTMHRVDSEEDLRDYISRLEEFQRVFSETVDNLKASEKASVVAPRFVYPYVLSASQNVITGRPFVNKGVDSPLLSDFQLKLKTLKLSPAKNKYFTAKAEKALREKVLPAYQVLISFLKQQEKRATTDAGVWKFPDGQEYYNRLLKNHTTTEKKALEIHELGLKEVARIHNEMRAILKKIQFTGSLQDFFKELRTNPKYFYSNTAQGREAYLKASRDFYKNISERAPEFFRLLPKAQFEIRPVEKFREDSAGVAFYEHPSEDGKRPGVYYVNLKEMKNLPKHQAEAVLYHEGTPGHHFQIAIAQELQSLPKFRRYGNYTAYAEGWALYTETLAIEMGAYKDDISRFGKLAEEILRAARLVVDTGLHFKKWTREEAIKYMAETCPSSIEDQKNEVERYIVMPGQATAYKVGMLKILELRHLMQTSLGKDYDVRDFHDVVLGNGAVPLFQLEELIKNRIAANKK